MTKRLSQLRIRLSHCGKIARDESGNIMWITALALFPLIGIVGSGVDMSRYYAAKTRLQQACDAGVIAAFARMKPMSIPYTSELNANVINAGRDTFNYNYPDKVYGSTSRSFSVGVPKGTVQNSMPVQLEASATSTIPPLIMQMFNMAPVQLSVNCSSRYESSRNVDIVLVLDTTGSMSKQDIKKGIAPNQTTITRLAALKESVNSFIDTVVDSQQEGTRVRIGLVPYSNNVNVGKLLPTDQFASEWTYVSYEGSSYKKDNIAAYIASNSTTRWKGPIWSSDFVWDGCIQEPETIIGSNPSTMNTIPNDLNVKYFADSDTEDKNKWKPNWKYSWTSRGNFAQYACPSESQLLTTYSKTVSGTTNTGKETLKTKINGLIADGGTFHDYGMMWGLRLIAPHGIFKAHNNAVPSNNLPVKRYIIFFTDGLIDTRMNNSSIFQGVEYRDKRYTGTRDPSKITMDTLHRNRFTFLCDQAKNKDIANAEIWVIAFGDDVSVQGTSADAIALSGCATSSAHAKDAKSAADLNTAFSDIASTIAKLRVTQ